MDAVAADAATTPSPPSRAAWIEIASTNRATILGYRRRLHGRRGLKLLVRIVTDALAESPPSRAAWIEIRDRKTEKHDYRVAAFTGGVD